MANSPKAKAVKFKQKAVRDNINGPYDNPEPHPLQNVMNRDDNDVHRLEDVINRPSDREDDMPSGASGSIWRRVR